MKQKPKPNLNLMFIFRLFLLLILIPAPLFAFPDSMRHAQDLKSINLKIKVINGTENLKVTAPLYSSLSAITDNFIIKSFKPENSTSPLIFKDVKIYPSANFYELAVSYKGVNYFKKLTIQELETLNSTPFKVYEQGNKKDFIKLERQDYIIEIDERNKVIRLTQDIIIRNDGNFTYSPLLPQKEVGIQLPLVQGVHTINPIFNLSKQNYQLFSDSIALHVFLRPGKNYFTFHYFLNPKEFPYLIRFKTRHETETTRVIVPDARNKIVSNLISNFSIRETEQGTIKIGIKKGIKPNKELKFKIMGKPNFKKGLISSSRNAFLSIKKIEHVIGYLGLILLFFALLYIIIFVKKQD